MFKNYVLFYQQHLHAYAPPPQGGGTARTAITTQLCGNKVNGFYLVGVKLIFRESKDGNALRSEFRQNRGYEMSNLC